MVKYTTRPYEMGLDDKVMLEQFRIIALPHIKEESVYNTRQKVGVGFDGDVGKFRVEMKDDKSSAKYPNAFIEIKQTFDNKVTWVESGLLLSIKQADLFVMALYHGIKSWFVWGPPKDWQKICLSYGTLSDTRPGANGNAPGRFAKGYLVKKTDIIPVSVVNAL
jgi:hypothetical protein